MLFQSITNFFQQLFKRPKAKPSDSYDIPDLFFEVGDEVGNEKGGVRIRLTKVDVASPYQRIEALVLAADDHWTDGIKYKAGQKGYFIIGETLSFDTPNQTAEYGLNYLTNSPGRTPWFILGITKDGRKYFEHYR